MMFGGFLDLRGRSSTLSTMLGDAPQDQVFVPLISKTIKLAPPPLLEWSVIIHGTVDTRVYCSIKPSSR